MLLVLLSAALYASANMVVKKLSGIERPGIIVFYMHAVTLPLALVGAVPYWIWPSMADLPWIAVLAVAGSVAHYCFTRSMHASEVSIVMPFDYLRLPMIALVGYFAYDQSAQPVTTATSPFFMPSRTMELPSFSISWSRAWDVMSVTGVFPSCYAFKSVKGMGLFYFTARKGRGRSCR